MYPMTEELATNADRSGVEDLIVILTGKLEIKCC